MKARIEVSGPVRPPATEEASPPQPVPDGKAVDIPLPPPGDDRALARMLGAALVAGLGLAVAAGWSIWVLVASVLP